MNFSLSLALFFSCLVFAGVPAVRETALESRQSFSYPPTCSDEGVHIIAVSGASNTPHGYGLLQSTVQEVLEAVPFSTNYSVPYPKMEANSSAASMVGVDHFIANLEWYTGGCPDTPVVILSYSLGAVVALNALCGRSHLESPYSAPLPATYAQYIIAIIAYGDESRIPNQSYDLGTCAGEGENPRGNPYGCHSFTPVMQSYCDEGDVLCCGGTDSGVHKSYPGKYNANVTSYITSQLQNRKNR